MEPGLIIGGAAAAVGVAVVAVVIVRVLRPGRESAAGSAVRAGEGPFGVGPAGPQLLSRLGLSDLVRHARDVVAWRVDDREVVAARTDGRGWATRRGSRSVSATVSGIAHSLVAVRLSGPLPTVNVVRDGVIGSNVDVEYGAFNEARDVRTDDDRLAHAVLTPRVIALLQDLPEDLTVQILDDHLISFRRGVPEAAEVQQRAQLLAEIADAIPDFVFERPGG